MEKNPKTQPARWWLIVALLFVVALINYFDRQSLSVVAPRMQSQLHLSDQGYAHIVTLFLLASTIAYGVAGFVADRIGTRRAMALFVGWWSLAEAATAFVSSAWMLGLTRFCLGLGEPGLWVAAPKAVSECVPKPRQGLAVGVYTLGATVGAVLALPVIAAVTTHLPWRSIFLLDGVVGLIWVPLWFLASRGKEHAAREQARGASLDDLWEVLRQPSTMKLLLARSITDPVWYFFLFWFPKYLLSARHMSMAEVSRVGWVVYLGAGVGTLVGGAAVGALIRRGVNVRVAYRTTMLTAAATVPLVPFIVLMGSGTGAALLAAVIGMAHMAWLVALTGLIIELYPGSHVGQAAGLIAMGSGFGGMLSSEIVGYLVMHGGYTPVFCLMALLHPIGITLLWPVYRQRGVSEKDAEIAVSATVRIEELKP